MAVVYAQFVTFDDEVLSSLSEVGRIRAFVCGSRMMMTVKHQL